VSPAPREEPSHRKARYWRVSRRRSRLWLAIIGWTVWAIIGLIVAVGAGAYIYLDNTLKAAAPDTPEARAARRATSPVLPGQPVNVLLIGSDTRPAIGDKGRSDTLILVRMDSKRGFISMLSFPRDLYVQIPGYGMDKINAAYSLGVAKTIETVQQLTHEKVNEYVVVDFTGFARLVDQVGGVYLDVDRKYFNQNIGTAATNYASINLDPGYQKLNGSDALSYVRYRHTDSDYSRIARQQQFLSDLKRQTKQIGNLTSITSFRKIFKDDVETSINSVPRFLSLLQLALTTPDNKIARIRIQGDANMTSAGASIQTASESEISTKVAEWKDPSFEEGQSASKPIDPSSVAVTVLNGSGKVLAAEGMAEALNTKRYATRVGGNAPSFDYTSSVVYYAPGFGEPAKKIRALLGHSASTAPLERKAAKGNEVVVVAGSDFNGELQPPPPAVTRPPASTIDTTSLVAGMRSAQRTSGFRVMVPMKVASGSRLRILRQYRINAGSGKGPPAIKLVFETGYHEYWGIEMTTMKNPPIVGGETGSYDSGGRKYLTYYDGLNLQRLAFRKGNVTFWISNTLQNDLSAKTIEEIAKSMRPLNRAKLLKGRTDTTIPVEYQGSTP
jgi:LCP family protein required for cell wall assembly